jgi:hypothetical protein
MKNLAKAIIAVMQDVKGIEKSLNVGTGNASYKGVADQEVKKVIGESMARNGLCILPLETNAKTQIDRWEEKTDYGIKQKQQIFTEVETKYLLLHDSGESQVISGYGHGVDNQDKSAGKATTYALKYALLYSFLVPTGKIDDADKDHSDSYDTPKQKSVSKQYPAKEVKPLLEKGSEQWKQAINHLLKGTVTIEAIKAKYTLLEPNEDELIALTKKTNTPA